MPGSLSSRCSLPQGRPCYSSFLPVSTSVEPRPFAQEASGLSGSTRERTPFSRVDWLCDQVTTTVVFGASRQSGQSPREELSTNGTLQGFHMPNSEQFPQEVPVVVIGGGPAGSTVSTLVAQQGHRVVLLERDHFPRFHIGESLIPETYWILKRLNMLDKMKQSHFVKKHSVQFVGQSGRLSEPFYFLDHKPHECSGTWQVVRSEFDKMMLDNAREHGVQVHEGTRVLEVLFDGDRAVGVRVVDDAGNERTVRAQVVVDASGQSAMLASRLKLREIDPQL